MRARLKGSFCRPEQDRGHLWEYWKKQSICAVLELYFVIICRVFRAAPASSPASPVAGSYAGFRRLLAYKVLKSASVSC